MTVEELRQEKEEITRIFLSVKYYSQDFSYLYAVKFVTPTVYSTFNLFVERMFHAVCVSLVIDLCKLFDKREKFSLKRLVNKMHMGYATSELNSHLSEDDFDKICMVLENDRIAILMKKLKTTRDEYYAHLDRSRTSFPLISMSNLEFDELISSAESFLKSIELKYFNVSVTYALSQGEMGHNLFERLEEWETYRSIYGLLRNK